MRQVGRQQGGHTGGSLLDILGSVVEGLLSGIDITLLARLGARGVGELLGYGLVTLYIRSGLASGSRTCGK